MQQVGDISITSWRQVKQPIVFLHTFALASKIGGTSEMKRKTSFSFTFHSVCTIFALRFKRESLIALNIPSAHRRGQLLSKSPVNPH